MTQNSAAESALGSATWGPHTARALVSTGHGGSEVWGFPVTEPAPGTGWLRVAASGICGTDVGLHAGDLPAPTVLGHHAVGEVVAAGPRAGQRWSDVEVGARVVVEEYLPCGHCPTCQGEWYRLCPETDLWTGGRRIGTVPADDGPGLWGGNAEHLFLPPNAVLHPIPDGLGWDEAVWALPFANALDWLAEAGRLAAGQSVLVLGPGYHGLSAVAAARVLGASQVLVTGLPSDAERLGWAEHLGARPVPGTPEEVGAAVRRLTGGAGVDVVLDTTGARGVPVATSLGLLAQRGHLVLTTPKGEVTVDSRDLTRSMHTISAVRGRSPQWVRRSLALLADGATGLTAVPSVAVSLAEAGPVLHDLATGAGPATPHVVVHPWKG